MSDTNTRFRFDRLKGRENYDEWRRAAKSYLIIKGLWTAIENDISPDVAPETNAKAIGEITLMVEPMLYNYIEDSLSAKKVWDGITNAFDDSGTARKVSIMQHLTRIRLEKHRNIEQYINEILLYWNKSKIAGFKIEEEVIASIMLGGLPEEYRAMILGIENSGVELTVDYVKTVLLQGIVEPLTKVDEEQKAMPAISNYTKKQNIRKSNQKNGNKRACYSCGSQGHFISSCPMRKSKPTQIAGRKCYICSQEGHIAVRCPNRRQRKRRNQIPQQQQQQQQQEQQSQEQTSLIALFNVKAKQNEIRNDWLIDSGATMHIANNKNFFKKLFISSTKEILVANNEKVKVEGVGNIELSVISQGRPREILIKRAIFVPDMVANLLSVKQMTEQGYTVRFIADKCQVIGRHQLVVLEAKLYNGMYKVELSEEQQQALIVTDDMNNLEPLL